ncbi:MAG: DUF503 family protein [Anaerolineae bacterium]|nr:DUF503 family protein [Anaerolineae bacterium]NIN98302.1 DUF503 family protein [Anaerolineae bacterium]NIQ81231.1 DUF503 family protein [Anaerolineae bacterium]
MVIGVCTLVLDIPSSHSLKDKRRVVKSILAKVRNQYNVSIAEVEANDSWQSAVVGIACVSNDASHAHGLLSRVVETISNTRFEAQVADYHIEIL